MTAVSTATKTKKGPIRERSATAPETIDAAVATNTIWKNQSDAEAYPLAVASMTSSPASSRGRR